MRIPVSIVEQLRRFPIAHQRAIAAGLEELAISPSTHAIPGAVMGYLPHMQGFLVFYPNADEPTDRYAIFFELNSDEVHLEVVLVGHVRLG